MGHTPMSQKLKVAVFNTQPPHLYFGGVERRIIEVAKRLVNNFETTVYSGTKKGFKETTVIDGITIVPCSSTDRIYPLDNWVFNRSISKMLDTIDSDVYEAHTVSGYKFLKRLRKQKTSKPFIQTVHGVLADEHIQASKSVSPSLRMKLSNVFMGRLAKIEKDAAKEADLIVTVSQYSLQKLVQLYEVDEAKIRVVPNGVDTQRFKPTEDCSGIKDVVGGDSKHVVLFVGNLIPRKGLHYLIEAAKHVTEEIEETKFVVVGDGPLKSHLIEYSKEQGVADNFVFLGSVPDDLLHRLYSCADVFASPSIQEGQGITLLEAQAMGKPVVAFNVTAIKEVVKNKETGLLVEPNSRELADVILALLSNQSLREKLGRSGREFVTKTYSWDICAQKMGQVYSEATEI
jgi:glycosyltransferase involved in cell wall biosynthesis